MKFQNPHTYSPTASADQHKEPPATDENLSRVLMYSEEYFLVYIYPIYANLYSFHNG